MTRKSGLLGTRRFDNDDLVWVVCISMDIEGGKYLHSDWEIVRGYNPFTRNYKVQIIDSKIYTSGEIISIPEKNF